MMSERAVTGMSPAQAALQTLAESLGVGVALVDEQGRQAYVNPAFARLLGWPREQLLGRSPPYVYWPEEELANIQAAFEATLRGEAPAEGFELRFLRSDGSRLEVLVSVSPYLEDGRQAGWVAAVIENTARIRVAQHREFLVQAGSILGTTLDYSSTLSNLARLAVPALADYCLIDLLDADGSIRRVEIAHKDPRQVEKLWEIWRRWPVKAEDDLGIGAVLRTGEPILAEQIDYQGMVRYAKSPERLQALMAMGITSSVIVPMRVGPAIIGAITLNSTDPNRHYGKADLELAQALADRAAAAVDHARLYAAARAAEREQRRSRQAEQAARLAAESLQTFTAVLAQALTVDEVMRVTMQSGVTAFGAFAGAIAERHDQQIVIRASTGYAPDEGMAPGKTWHLDSLVPIAQAIRTGHAVLLASPDAWRAQFGVQGLTGRSAAWVAVPIRFSDPPAALIWTFDQPRDFSAADRDLFSTLASQAGQALERARLFEAERAARAAAETANRAKLDFLTMMSHELRTPLNAITGYVDLMEIGIYGDINETQAEALLKVKQSAHHLLVLISELLSFAKLQAGQTEVRLRDCELQALLREVEPMIAPQVAAKQLAFQLRPPAAELRFRSDLDKLRQILLNLLTNAVKFTPAGGTITLAAAADADQLHISVSDTGVGISRDSIEQIFDPFVQLNRDLTSGHQGVGLGLAISRDLARALGGTLEACSTPGQGSTFTLTLPRNASTQ